MFFSYFYFALNAGSLLSNTILVYFEDSGHWTAGIPLTRVAQVFVAASKKWKVSVLTDGDELYELEGSESAIKGSRKIYHSDNFRVLDKAATLREKEMTDPSKQNTWRLSTVNQVEEVKCILKMLPIWLCTIIYSVIFTQMASLFVEQGDFMNSDIGSSHLPATSMSAFDIMSVLIFTFVYNQLLVPVNGRLTGNPYISQLQRMGIGLLIGVLAMLAAATEIHRLKYVNSKGETSS
ncbi:hypothetical protein Sjap_005517 [Stephania japonica]|uniref:Uncharacterized protein n=1 Tax=Stephania japonica TaxID=461633 RepID=A0AAP0PK58_9MAGN